MKLNEATLKLKRAILLVGIGLISLAFFGCGGGGGGGVLTSAPTLKINSGKALLSVSRVGGPSSRALGKIAAGDLQIFSLDGTAQIFAADQDNDQLISSTERAAASTKVAVVNFPVAVELGTALKTVATNQGVLVACLSSGNQEYRSIIRVKEADLVINASKTEDVDGGTTVIAALVESEMEGQLGVAVKSCEELSGDTKAKISAVVSIHPSNTSGVAIEELTESLQTAAAQPDSLISKIITDTGSSVNPDANISLGSEIKRYLRTGKSRTGTVSPAAAQRTARGRKLTKAATKLARKARSTGGASISNFITEVLSATESEATTKAAAGSLIADIVGVNEKASDDLTGTAANTAIANVIGTGNLADALTATTDQLLPTLTGEVAATLEANGALGEFSGVLGGIAVVDENARDTAIEKLGEALNVVGSSDAQEDLLGGMLRAASNNSAATTAVLDLAVKEKLDIGESLLTVADDSSIGDILASVFLTIEDSFSDSIEVDTIVSELEADLTLEDLLVVIDSGVATSIIDKARIGGSASVSIQTTGTITFNNNSIETGSGPYDYVWFHAGLSVLAGDKTSDEITIRTPSAGNYTINLQQTVGSAVTTAPVSLKVAAGAISPSISLSEQGVEIKAGKSGSIGVDIFNSGANTPATTVVGQPGITFSGLTGSGGRLTINVGALVSAGTYQVQVTVGTASGTFSITVPTPGPTKVSLIGVKSVTAGTALTVKANATQEEAVTAGAELRLWISPGNTANLPNESKALVVGFTSVSTTVTLAAGSYMAWADASKGGVNPTTASEPFFVNEVGAPTIDSIAVNGRVGRRTITTNVATIDVPLVVQASSDADSIIATATLNGNDTLATGSGGSLTLSGLMAGIYQVIVTATNTTTSKSVSEAFELEIIVRQEVGVTHVALSGSTNGANISANSTGGQGASLPVTYTGSFQIDASSVEGLNLNTQPSDTLAFQVYTSGTRTLISNATITVSLRQAGSQREADLTVSGAAITAGNTGWDVSDASSFEFSGKRENGTTANVRVTSIVGFDDLFTEISDGLQLNLLKLRDAMQSIVLPGTPAFSSTFDSLAGDNIEVTVKVEADNFSFTHNGNRFTTFKVTGISVE
jgi:hypothetical protein